MKRRRSSRPFHNVLSLLVLGGQGFVRSAHTHSTTSQQDPWRVLLYKLWSGMQKYVGYRQDLNKICGAFCFKSLEWYAEDSPEVRVTDKIATKSAARFILDKLCQGRYAQVRVTNNISTRSVARFA
jgi:hypothetical protein